MIRLIIGIIIFMISVYVGIVIKKFFVSKCKIYEEMLDFVTFTQGEIQFFGTNINDLMCKYCTNNDNLLSNALKNIHIPDRCSEEDLQTNFLSKNGKILLIEFINNLSRLNSVTQKEYIANYKNKILKEMDVCKLELSSKGEIYKKISPFVGLTIAIIIF